MTEQKTKKKKSMKFIALDQTKQKALALKAKKHKIKEPEEFERAVVFIKHIPHGFFEPQMKRYFQQFGNITRLRLSRSKKTGRPKGYAYIEFECDAVAKVVAETMNNYLMFEKSLKCEVVPKDKLHPDVFKGWNRKFYKPCTRKAAIQRFNNQSMDAEKVKNREKRRNLTQSRLKSKLEKLGVEYDFTNLATNPNWSEPPRRLRKSSDQDTVTTDPLDTTEEAEILVDSEDDEVTFKTPPKGSKVRVRSLRSVKASVGGEIGNARVETEVPFASDEKVVSEPAGQQGGKIGNTGVKTEVQLPSDEKHVPKPAGQQKVKSSNNIDPSDDADATKVKSVGAISEKRAEKAKPRRPKRRAASLAPAASSEAAAVTLIAPAHDASSSSPAIRKPPKTASRRSLLLARRRSLLLEKIG